MCSLPISLWMHWAPCTTRSLPAQQPVSDAIPYGFPQDRVLKEMSCCLFACCLDIFLYKQIMACRIQICAFSLENSLSLPFLYSQLCFTSSLHCPSYLFTPFLFIQFCFSICFLTLISVRTLHTPQDSLFLISSLSAAPRAWIFFFTVENKRSNILSPISKLRHSESGWLR